MRANFMWMINDFSAYSIMSGWSTSSFLACPTCAKNTVSEWLYKSKKNMLYGAWTFQRGSSVTPAHRTGYLVKCR